MASTIEDAVEEVTKKYSGCESDPYEALRPYISGGQVTPQQVGSSLRNGIDPALACRLSKFLAYANKNVCATKIISGFRSYQQQLSMCGPGGRASCAAPGGSCHQYGLAVDLTSDCGGKLRPLARQFKLIFPYSGIHVQCVEHPGAGRSSCRGPCNGGVEIASEPGSGNYGPPSSGLSSAARDLFGGGQQQQEMCRLPDGYQVPCASIANKGGAPGGASGGAPSGGAPSGGGTPSGGSSASQPTLNGQNTTASPANTCSPQFYCVQDSLYYRTSTCVDQLYETCPSGCSGSKCLSPVSGLLSNIGKEATSTKTASNTSKQKTSTSSVSAFDQITSLASEPGETGTSSAPVDPFDVVVDGNDTVALKDKGKTETSTLAQKTLGGTMPPIAGQTFTSGDLKYTQGSASPQEVTGLRATLIRIRDALANILAYLRPFGRPLPSEQEYAE